MTAQPISGTPFPFSAILGQDDLKTALLLNAIDPQVGGVLIQGERGTAKSTAARGLAALLPPTTVYADNPFGCGPGDEDYRVCDASAPLVETRPPFVELPIGTSEDRVTGTLDLERTLRTGERHFEPGLLALAHRGVLYIDEVNLLPDHLVDLLLDVAASGTHAVEREGISVRHPARFQLIGTMNPEEGDLRPQFVDRFGLSVVVHAPADPSERMQVVRRRIAFDADPRRFAEDWADREEALGARLRHARDHVARVEVPDPLLALAVRICLEANVDGLRPDLTLYRAARGLAALDGRARVVEDDVYRGALLVLGHRRRPHPLSPPPGGSAPRGLEEIVEQLRAEAPPDAGQPGETADAAGDLRKTSEAPEAPEHGPAAPDRQAAPSGLIQLHLPRTNPSSRPSAAAIRRGPSRQAGAQGRVIGSRAWDAGALDLAPLATALAAARSGHLTAGLDVADLRQRRRRAPERRLVLVVLDCSGSMGARDRMAVTKAAILGLLGDAYRHRDLIALMSFRDRGSSMLVSPTRAVAQAVASLHDLPTGGRTPLGQALRDAAALVRREVGRLQVTGTCVVLVTDGRGAAEDLDAGADALTGCAPDIVVVDTESGFVQLGRARKLAERLAARYIRLAA